MSSPSAARSAVSGLDELCINTIRFLAVDAVQHADSGHPGMPMGAAPMAYVLWTRHLKHNPADPDWFDRDRFVLSAGHGSMLLYALLHLTGYDLSLDDIKNFRQWGSKTPGHPERHLTRGVEATTGPLGQGFANGVGLAIAERYLAARYNRDGHAPVGHFTYSIVSDGDLMEGVASEAASLAGHLELGKLIYLYDANGISLAAPTALTFTEDVTKRFDAYGWQTQTVEDGNDVEAIDRALRAARAETGRPSLITVRTHIGYGSPHKQDTPDAHGSPLGSEEVKLTKERLGWPVEPAFHIPEAALAHLREAAARGKSAQSEWERRAASHAAAHPELGSELQRVIRDELPEGWDSGVPSFPADAKGMATRSASGKVLNALASRIPTLIGGSADLDPSTYTALEKMGEFGPARDGSSPSGRNLHFGVREHAMGSIVNGLAVHGGIIPFGATFLVFSDYMRPALRLAALMEAHGIFVFTHDSIGLGEDGPTHQPVEHLASLRAIPGLTVLRPCDANETAEAWKVAIESRRPVALVLTRQAVPTLDRTRTAPAAGLRRGAYVLSEAPGGKIDLILIATGSEVPLALEAQQTLAGRGVHARVVSMPGWEIFQEQPPEYVESVLPSSVTARISVEAASPQGWCAFTGDGGATIGLDRFGASAPGKVVFEKLGFTASHLVERALTLLGI